MDHCKLFIYILHRAGKGDKKDWVMAMVVASLAALYANLLAGIEEWPRIH